MEQWLPKFYTQIAKVFELSPVVDEDQIVDSFTNGLDYLHSRPVPQGGRDTVQRRDQP